MSSAPHASEPLHRLSTSNASSSAASTSQQQQQPGSDPNNSLKRKRVRTGCHTCRRRKVKCDEARPVCDDCNRLDLPCVWPEPQARSAESNEDRPIKRRKRRACTSCHADKAACSRERPICSRCRERGQACVYESTDAGSNNQDTSPSVAGDSHLSTASPAGGLARLEMQSEMATSMSVKELVELYFQKVHPLNWCSFIHRGTFMQAFQDDQVPVSLLQTMCATAVQYLPNANLSEAAKWIEDARKTVTSNMFVNPTVELLQTLVLAYVWEMGNGDALPQWMLSSLASRLAYALRLNVESNQPGLSWAQQESRRRLMWACFCVDAFVSGGIKEFECLPLFSIQIQLPANERNYLLNIEDTTRQLKLPYSTMPPRTSAEGILACLISQVAIRKRVMQYVVNLSGDGSQPWEPNSPFDSCRADLLAWRADLPPQLELTKENVAARQSTGQLAQLVALHVRYHGITYGLFRIAIYGFVEAAKPEILMSAPHDWLRRTQEECFKAAFEVTTVALFVLNTVPDFVVEDPTVPAALYDALRVTAWGFANLVPPHELSAQQIAALPRITASVKLMLRAAALFKTARRLVSMMSHKILHQPQMAFVVESLKHHGSPWLPSDDSASGTRTPRETWGPHVRESTHHSIILRATKELEKAVADQHKQQSANERPDIGPSATTHVLHDATQHEQTDMGGLDVTSLLQTHGNFDDPHFFPWLLSSEEATLLNSTSADEPAQPAPTGLPFATDFPAGVAPNSLAHSSDLNGLDWAWPA